MISYKPTAKTVPGDLIFVKNRFCGMLMSKTSIPSLVGQFMGEAEIIYKLTCLHPVTGITVISYAFYSIQVLK